MLLDRPPWSCCSPRPGSDDWCATITPSRRGGARRPTIAVNKSTDVAESHDDQPSVRRARTEFDDVRKYEHSRSGEGSERVPHCLFVGEAQPYLWLYAFGPRVLQTGTSTP